MKPVYYSEYLQLDKILNAQEEESKKLNVRADDEMLFIIIHQSYELWLKQILHEVNIAREIFLQDKIQDNSNQLNNVVHRLKRVGKILEMMVAKFGILETMTPLDFLDFRDYLRPASGFQSIQFKMVEALLGLQFEKRFGQQYYVSQLKPEDVDRVKQIENETSLIVLVNKWLERMPYFKDTANWGAENDFIENYRKVYAATLQEGEQHNLEAFDQIFMNKGKYDENRRFSMEANRAALFIILYRDYPLLNAPYEFINCLLEIDQHLAQWRYRHMNMVERMIGKRLGTGGSSGAHYLKSAADSHYVFKEFVELTSYLIQRAKLPQLPTGLANQLGFSNQ